MNKKKLGILALTVGVSGSVLIISAFSALANSTSGYDQYKNAFKQTKAVENMTGNLEVSVKDNGKTLFTIDSTIKKDLKNHECSAKINIQSNGKTQTLDMFNQGEEKIFKASDSDLYYVKKGKEKKHHHKSGDHDQDMEYVIDVLMSGLRKDIQSVNKADGNKEVSLSLLGSQISPVVQALGSVLVQKATDKHEHDHHHKRVPFFNKEELKSSLPKLTQDIKMKQVNVKAEINDKNLIEEQTAEVTITGKDAAGKEHEVTINLKLELSQFNNTVTDKVDLNGKKVKTFERKTH